jgi:hypothetical protein
MCKLIIPGVLVVGQFGVYCDYAACTDFFKGLINQTDLLPGELNFFFLREG